MGIYLMIHSTKTRSRVARAAFVALLMSSAATAALAAPKHHRASAGSSNAALAAEVKDLRAQVEELKATVAAQAQAQQTPQAQAQAQQAQIDSLGQQLSDVKQAQDTANADIISLKAPPTGSVVIPTLPNGKPAFATADGRFTANVRAIVMFDTGKYLQDHNLPSTVNGRDLNSGTNFRRARFGIDGKLFKDFDYALIYEFGGSGGEDAGHIQEAWAQYTALKPWRIRLGAFEPNIGLAAAVSTSQMPLLERPSPAEIARNVAAGDSRSALQVTGNGVFGEGDTGLAARWFASTAFTGNTVGTINSSNTVTIPSALPATPTVVGVGTVQPFGEQTAWIGRLAIAPFMSNDWQAHIGVNYQYVFNPNDATGIGTTGTRYPVQLRDRPELRLDATRLIDTGAIDARHISVLGGEGGLTFRNFLLEGEYFHWNIDRRNTGAVPLGNPTFNGYYVQGVWVITGEPRPYNPAEARFDAPKMAYNFNPAANTWGTWELAARFSDTDLNWHEGAARLATPTGGIRGGEQKITSVGLNWYLNPSMRFMLDYLHVDVNRLTSTGAQAGQTYNAVALRSQLSF
jgi:phosphate-selective porin OprO/OprP